MDVLLECFFVGIGGALGAMNRYLIGLIPVRHTGGFPVLTLFINVLGAFCIGLIAVYAGKRPEFDPRLILFLKVGVCGGFTTFSTFSFETTQLMQNGKAGTAVIYALLSVSLCVGAVMMAQAIGE